MIFSCNGKESGTASRRAAARRVDGPAPVGKGAWNKGTGLAEEMGVDPGSRLKELYRRMLVSDDGLLAISLPERTPASPAGGAEQPVARVPRQLPAALALHRKQGRSAAAHRMTANLTTDGPDRPTAPQPSTSRRQGN
ncbi:hypothetical protein ACFVY0_02430 [Streptomyces sp. NPDC058286]|uniref:hypothetical protein n=1 Tax=Streptomyces sp. NPDC058286 TaxID=3346422 RepID=UPI0036EB25DA